ncbi:N-methyl-D-aspartate receptor NMDAR2C subunit [Candidatus Woesearchaeota archaeon]|nr:N-methyl-D-aspartate receptor NMDAR2C subunit [Candidatus Woesearchaeota archaeon]
MKSLDRWVDFWKRIGAAGDSGRVYLQLAVMYSQTDRAYHTMHHIMECLDEFEQARHLPEHPLEVEMAIWFHDAVYDTHAKDNEERSAQLALESGRAMKLPEELGKRVYDLILATRHVQIPEGMDAQVLTDIDLSGFGKSEEVFDENTRKIRAEYHWVPEEDFRAERAWILLGFLERPSIYATEFFQQKYEAQARKNLERELVRLRM